MKKSVLVLFLFILCSSFASADWFFNSEEIKVRMTIEGGADIIEEKANSRIESVGVNLSLFPHSYVGQKVDYLQRTPIPDQTGVGTIYSFENPGDSISFIVDSEITSRNTPYPIRDVIPFPLKSVPDEVKHYTLPTEIINSDDPDIIRLASSLAAGEDDLYEVVFKIAAWTKNNIEYNLSTLNVEASHPASDVLAARNGVCDELTSLFLALLRSLGIPGKFVTGYAYTNSPLFDEEWGAHGWSEVYFPGFGWVAFDVTYGQYGFVDPTHIKLKESIDPGDSSTRYQWSGHAVDLDIYPLDTSLELIDYSGEVLEPLDISVEVLKDKTGFRSFNGVEVIVENTADYYIATDLSLSVPEELSVIGEKTEAILVKPGEYKKLYWMFSLDGRFDEGFRYTFPIAAYTSRNHSGRALFESTANDPWFTSNQIEDIIDQRKEEVEKVYSSLVDLDCSISDNSFYVYETAEITCTVENKGNTLLDSLEICYVQTCEEFDLGITQQQEMSFSVDSSLVGKREEQVIARSEHVSKSNTLVFEVFDEPSLDIIDIVSPDSVSYDEEYTVTFLLNKTSYSSPQELDITIFQPFSEKGWTLSELPAKHAFELRSLGSELQEGENTNTIVIVYKDGNGKEYKTEAEFTVSLDNVNLGQKMLILLNKVFRVFQ